MSYLYHALSTYSVGGALGRIIKFNKVITNHFGNCRLFRLRALFDIFFVAGLRGCSAVPDFSFLGGIAAAPAFFRVVPLCLHKSLPHSPEA